MALFQQNQYDLLPTIPRTTVPDNDMARLMYYLSCVFHTIEYEDQDIRKYRDYQRWSMLSHAEQRVVWSLTLTFSPDEFDGKIFFHSDALCGDSLNKFYESSQVPNQLLAVQSILIAGQTRQVKKIMTYRMSWIQNNYLEPKKRLAPYFESSSTATGDSPTTAYVVQNSDACVIS